MQKKFIEWHCLKEVLQNKNTKVYFAEREVWYCSLGSNIGNEQDGKHQLFERPVLIYRKF